VDARRLAELIAARGAAVEIEAFEVSHVEAAIELRDAGVLADPLRFNLVLGVPGGLSATVRNLQMLATSVPSGCHWTVTAVGRHQRRMLATGILLGASGVRVGFEDSVYEGKGRLAPSNAALVRQIRAVTEALGRAVATPDEARDLLGVGPPVLDRSARLGVRSEGIESGPVDHDGPDYEEGVLADGQPSDW
jgi:3-keto-5-aminohexanoate cleavage enzyme